jgi:hypothetical protein
MTKKQSEKAQPEKAKSLEEMILNYPEGKYSAIPLAALWAKVLRRKEEHRHLTSNEILELALREVLTGEVGWKEVKKGLASAPPEPNGILSGASEEKASKK